MKPRLLLFVLITLLLPALCLAAPKNKAEISAKRRISLPAKASTAEARRIALVIGNSAYTDKPLKNPVNDARLIGKVLQEAGFELYAGKVHENLGYARMMETVEGFGSTLGSDGVAMVFYAGHGMQSNGNNYLIPVDASIRAENELNYKTVNAGLVLAKMEQARSRVNIVVLDACRDNPFRSFRTASGGLAAMTAPAGTLVAYSTGPGSVAEDGAGRNSIYSESLAKALKQQGITIEEAFKQVRSQVRKKTGNKQTPWENTSLEGNFIFINTTAPVTVQQTPSANHAADAEKDAWLLIKESSDVADLKDFLDKFPGGAFANTARIKLRQLEKKQSSDNASARAERERLAREKAETEQARADAASRPAPIAPVASSSRSFTDPTTGMEFVQVPKGFSIGKYEVTQGQWKKVMGANPSHFSSCGDNCPVENVSWNDAQQFISKLNSMSGKSYRLPTEAEWEYACRAGENNEYCGSNDVNAVAWYASNSGSKTHPVGQKQANGWGIHDMSGNVWEWVQDAEGSDRVLRGGSWGDIPEYVRAASWGGPYRRSIDIGFRLVLSTQ